MKTFANKVAVITGGAKGFGREFANIGAQLGMKLVLADVQFEVLEKTRAELEAQGADVLAVHCDVRKPKDVQMLSEAAMEQFGVVHLLFNNAGVGTGGLIWEHEAADWDWVLGANLWGVIHGVRVFTPLMLECSKKDACYEGHIVNTASFAGLVNAPLMGIYNVSKHAVVSLSESLYRDLDLIQAPIGTSVLCPLFSPTAIHHSERHRPDELRNKTTSTVSQHVSQLMIAKAVKSAKISPAQIAARTFDAIRNKKFYIHSQPETPSEVETRMKDLILQRNPSDFYDSSPELQKMLRAKLSVK